MNLDLSRIRGR